MTEPVHPSVARDRAYWAVVERIAAERGYGIPELFKYWPAYALRRDQVRYLAHYEMFKMVLDRPGAFVDVGVFRGTSLFTWSNLLEIFSPFDRSRLVFGFDSFEGLTDVGAEDAPTAERAAAIRGTWMSSEDEIRALVDGHNADAMIETANRIRLVVGNVAETMPRFVRENPGLRISLLYLDVDLYAPTKVALENLWDLVVPGGIVAFDEYAEIEWPGESQAVDEFFAQLPERPQIRKLPFAHKPSFVIK